MEKLLVPLGFDRAEEFLQKGKALHLIQMKRAGLQVPDFLVLTPAGTRQILAPIRDNIESILARAIIKSEKELFNCSREIQDLFAGFEIPPSIFKAIDSACAGLFGHSFSVAVRSSVQGEDGGSASFAGLHKSMLNCDRDQLSGAILACIASAWDSNALIYRDKKGIPIHDIQTSLLIQQMVNATKSGVAFSMNVHGNLADSVVVAGPGLGIGIVENTVDTDTYWVNRQNHSIRSQLMRTKEGTKAGVGAGKHRWKTSDGEKPEPILSEKEIEAVHKACMKAEALLGRPSDIEFSLDEEGKLFLLQMRPITTLEHSNLIILDNTNIIESYPEITLPLSFTLANKAYEQVFKGSGKAFWLSNNEIKSFEAVFAHLLAHFRGRVYYRLDNWYKMASLVYSSNKSMDAWEKAVGLTNTERRQVGFSFQKRFKTIALALWLILSIRRGNKRFFRIFDSQYQRLRKIDGVQDSAASLWAHVEDTTQSLFAPWYQTLINDFLAFKAFSWLENLCERFVVMEGADVNLANDLMSGLGNTDSEAAILRVLDLKEKIKSHDGLLALFQAEPAVIWKQLQTAAYADFHAHLIQHLDKYGDRVLAELKLEIPSYRKKPELFVALLKSQLTSELTSDNFKRLQTQIRERAREKVKNALPIWHPARHLIALVSGLSRFGLRSRENMRFCRTRAYGLMKDIFGAFGKLFKKEGIIEAEKDIYYLKLTEVESICTSGITQDLKKKVEERKRTYKEWRQLDDELPGRIICEPNQLAKLSFEDDRAESEAGDSFVGVAVSGGVVEGEVQVVLNPDPSLSLKNKILVSTMTDPGWVFLMIQSIGLISEKGSLLSHTAIVGRELGIPVVVGVKDATRILKSGERVKMDGQSGKIIKIKQEDRERI